MGLERESETGREKWAEGPPSPPGVPARPGLGVLRRLPHATARGASRAWPAASRAIGPPLRWASALRLRHKVAALAALALAAPAVPAFALPGEDGRGGGLAVSAQLRGCGDAGSGVVCEVDVSHGTVSGASRYEATVTGPDGSVTALGEVGPGGARVWVPYVGNGTYSVEVAAYGDADESKGERRVLESERASTGGGQGQAADGEEEQEEAADKGSDPGGADGGAEERSAGPKGGGPEAAPEQEDRGLSTDCEPAPVDAERTAPTGAGEATAADPTSAPDAGADPGSTAPDAGAEQPAEDADPTTPEGEAESGGEEATPADPPVDAAPSPPQETGDCPPS